MTLYIYIDESGKLYHETKYQNYTAVVFTSGKAVSEFTNEFRNSIKSISQQNPELVSKDNKEIKGSELGSNKENADYQKSLLSGLKKGKSYLKIFSMGVDLTGCDKNYGENDEQCLDLGTRMKQGLINDVIIKYFKYLIDNLYEKNGEKLVVKIYVDKETVKEKLKEEITQILSTSPLHLSKKIELVVKIGLDSKKYSGIQLADLVANGLQRNYQRTNSCGQFRKFFKEITEIEMPIVKTGRLERKK